MSETFVLVHGAWHGAWCWSAVMAELQRMGHRAYALDLPGRWSHPMPHAQINRHVWVDAVVKLIEESDFRNVVLAGHSMGGITISGVALKIPQRLKRVIYMTALVPPEEGSVADELSRLPNTGLAAALRQIDGGISSALDLDYLRSNFIQDASHDLQDFVAAAMVPEAMLPSGDPVPMNQFHSLGVPTSYIVCEEDLVFGDPLVWHPGFSERLRNPTTRRLKCGHELMFTQPIATAHALAELSGS